MLVTAVCCAQVFEPAYRKNFPNVTRWFTTCVNQPEFVAIMGEVKLCEKMQQAAAPKKAKAEKKPKQAAAKPKEQAKPKKSSSGKPKHPLDDSVIGKSSMAMDDWKREYSNKDTVGEGSACEWLWKNFDPKGYKWYWCKGKYAKEQTKAWQAANLLGGFLQRWEPCRKYCFGVMLIMGEDKPGGMMIEGAMMFRGQDIMQEFKEIPDYETFDMEPINIDDAGQKKKLEAYLSWGEYGTDKDLPGPCLDGKEFK